MTAQYMVHLIHYNLRIMGAPIDGEVKTFSDNEEVWKTSVRSEAALKKNHVSICFYALYKSVARIVMCVEFVKGKNNMAYCC